MTHITYMSCGSKIRGFGLFEQPLKVCFPYVMWSSSCSQDVLIIREYVEVTTKRYALFLQSTQWKAVLVGMEHDVFGLVEVRKREVTTLNFWQSKAPHTLQMTRPRRVSNSFSQFSMSLFNVEGTRKVTLIAHVSSTPTKQSV